MHTEENKQVMARNIKRFMDRKGVSNQKLCEDLGFKYTTFMDWIKGATYPRIGKIEAMANYFGVQKSDLIEEKNIDNSPVEMAERYTEMINDEDMNIIFDLLCGMDASKRKIAINILRGLAETETEV